MNGLRWILGLTTAFVTAGYLLMLVASGSFRRSFGASENNPLLLALPILGAALLLGSILLPGNRPLLHAAAVASLGMTAICVWQILSESATILWLAVFYFAAWFVYYWSFTWHTHTQR